MVMVFASVQLNMDVHPPVPPLPLPEGKEISVWRYQQTLDDLENQELELCKKRLRHNQELAEETAAKKVAAQAKLEATETPFTKDVRTIQIPLCSFMLKTYILSAITIQCNAKQHAAKRHKDS